MTNRGAGRSAGSGERSKTNHFTSPQYSQYQLNQRASMCADFLDSVFEIESEFVRAGAEAGERDGRLRAQAEALVLVRGSMRICDCLRSNMTFHSSVLLPRCASLPHCAGSSKRSRSGLRYGIQRRLCIGRSGITCPRPLVAVRIAVIIGFRCFKIDYFHLM